jgi:hypothetical protein
MLICSLHSTTRIALGDAHRVHDIAATTRNQSLKTPYLRVRNQSTSRDYVAAGTRTLPFTRLRIVSRLKSEHSCFIRPIMRSCRSCAVSFPRCSDNQGYSRGEAIYGARSTSHNLK